MTWVLHQPRERSWPSLISKRNHYLRCLAYILRMIVVSVLNWCWYETCITMTSHERLAVSNYLHLDRLFTILVILAAKKTQLFHITVHLGGESIGSGWLHLTKKQQREFLLGFLLLWFSMVNPCDYCWGTTASVELVLTCDYLQQIFFIIFPLSQLKRLHNFYK